MLAALAWQLPSDSRVWRAVDPIGANDMVARLLRVIENDIATFYWSFTEDAKNKNTAPQPITLPGEKEAQQRAEEEADENATEVARIFGLKI